MKKICTLLVLLSLAFLSQAQLWGIKHMLPSGVKSEVAFSIGSYAYVYSPNTANNFYQYDPATDTWTAKANFPGSKRTGPIAFAIGSYGYIGSGSYGDTTSAFDFYQYDPGTNTWAAKANYPDSAYQSFSFNLGSLGYAGAGKRPTSYGSGYSKKCFAYNPTSDQWVQKNNIPDSIYLQYGCLSMPINGIGYCLYSNSSFGYTSTTFAYDPNTDAWSKKANAPPLGITAAGQVSGCVQGSKLYINYPRDNNSSILDVYDAANDTWTNQASYPQGPCSYPHDKDAPAFSIGSKMYFIITNNCFGTKFWELDLSHSDSIVSLSTDTTCAYQQISVTLGSDVSYNGGNFFKLVWASDRNVSPNLLLVSDSIAATGPGTYVFNVPYASNTLYPWNLSLISTSPATQTQFHNQTVYIRSSPTPQGNMPASYSVCNGVAAHLYSNGVFNEKHYWSNSTGIVDSVNSQIFVSPGSTTAYYFKSIIPATGCAYYDTTIVYVGSLPVPNINDSTPALCPGNTISIGGSAVANYGYAWAGPGGFTSSVAAPNITPTISGNYALTVTDTTSHCSATTAVNVHVKTPPAQGLCLVTVDSATNRNLIVWEKLDKFATDSFYIYRETSTNNYTKIAAIHRDSLSQFEDADANPAVTGYRYKITAVDTCGHESVLSDYHNTIHLQYIGSGNLLWNQYLIENATTPVASFDVYRDSTGTGNWVLMVTVPGTQYSATDLNFAANPGSRYQVHANWSYTCTPTRSAGFTEVLSNVTDQSTVGINGLSTTNFSIYPNPAKNLLYIQAADAAQSILSVYDLNGQKLIEGKYAPQIDLSHLTAGSYFIELKKDGITSRKMFIKL